MFPTPHHLKGT